MGKKEDLYRAFRLKMLKETIGGKRKNWILVGIGIALLILGIYTSLNPSFWTTLLERVGVKL